MRDIDWRHCLLFFFACLPNPENHRTLSIVALRDTMLGVRHVLTSGRWLGETAACMHTVDPWVSEWDPCALAVSDSACCSAAVEHIEIVADLGSGASGQEQVRVQRRTQEWRL
jgi:hypothetical protein